MAAAINGRTSRYAVTNDVTGRKCLGVDASRHGHTRPAFDIYHPNDDRTVTNSTWFYRCKRYWDWTQDALVRCYDEPENASPTSPTHLVDPNYPTLLILTRGWYGSVPAKKNSNSKISSQTTSTTTRTVRTTINAGSFSPPFLHQINTLRIVIYA